MIGVVVPPAFVEVNAFTHKVGITHVREHVVIAQFEKPWLGGCNAIIECLGASMLDVVAAIIRREFVRTVPAMAAFLDGSVAKLDQPIPPGYRVPERHVHSLA